MIEAGGADIDANTLALKILLRQSGIFERAPHDLQKNTLLRIHVGRFTRGKSEQDRIEIVNVFKYTSCEGISFAGDAARRMPEPGFVPSIIGNRAYGTYIALQKRK